jgi:hypothetical protein
MIFYKKLKIKISKMFVSKDIFNGFFLFEIQGD